jgi:hypothetical protein
MRLRVAECVTADDVELDMASLLVEVAANERNEVFKSVRSPNAVGWNFILKSVPLEAI